MFSTPLFIDNHHFLFISGQSQQHPSRSLVQNYEELNVIMNDQTKEVTNFTLLNSSTAIIAAKPKMESVKPFKKGKKNNKLTKYAKIVMNVNITFYFLRLFGGSKFSDR